MSSVFFDKKYSVLEQDLLAYYIPFINYLVNRERGHNEKNI